MKLKSICLFFCLFFVLALPVFATLTQIDNSPYWYDDVNDVTWYANEISGDWNFVNSEALSYFYGDYSEWSLPSISQTLSLIEQSNAGSSFLNNQSHEGQRREIWTREEENEKANRYEIEYVSSQWNILNVGYVPKTNINHSFIVHTGKIENSCLTFTSPTSQDVGYTGVHGPVVTWVYPNSCPQYFGPLYLYKGNNEIVMKDDLVYNDGIWPGWYVPENLDTDSDYNIRIIDVEQGIYSVTDNFTIINTNQEQPPDDNKPPTAVIANGEEITVSVNTGITFKSETTDEDGEIKSCFWDFGDGTEGWGHSINHTYEYEGTYTVTLIATDDDMATDEDTCSVNVTQSKWGLKVYTSFNFNTDKWPIDEYDIGEEVCAGMTIYDLWYFMERKNNESGLYDDYLSCDIDYLKDMASEAHSYASNNYWMQWPADDLDDVAENLLDGLLEYNEPQILTVYFGWGKIHTIFVYGYNGCEANPYFEVYDPMCDLSPQKIYVYNGEVGEYQNCGLLSTGKYTFYGNLKNVSYSEMQNVYQQYPPCENQRSEPNQKGIVFASWDKNELCNANNYIESLSSTGADWIQFVPTYYQEDKYSNELYFDENKTVDDECLKKAIDKSKQLGMKVFLKPHVDALNNAWRGDFIPEDSKKWFISYKEMIVKYAKLANEKNVDMFSVGCELTELTDSKYTQDWIDIIQLVKQYYNGPLTYASNYNKEEDIQFWNRLNYIGIDAYYPLTSNSNASTSDMIDSWKTNWVPIIEDLHAQWNKKVIFTEIGYRSVDGANTKPSDYTMSGSYDEQEQADCYTAALQVFWSKPWFEGIFWWAWRYNPEKLDPTDYTPQKKYAEDVIRIFY